MIIFMDNPNMLWEVQQHFPGRNISVFNLSSLYSGYVDLTNLLTQIQPINSTGLPANLFVQSLEFDMQYMAGIFNNPMLFSNFMSFMSQAFEGFIVVLLVQRDEYRDAIMESLIKLIQQRYGYNCWVIENSEDLSYVHEESFTPSGLETIIQDLKVFDNAYNSQNRICVE